MNKKVIFLCLFLYSSVMSQPSAIRGPVNMPPPMGQPSGPMNIPPSPMGQPSKLMGTPPPSIKRPAIPDGPTNGKDQQDDSRQEKNPDRTEAAISRKKMKQAKILSENAVKHILSVSIEDACYDFIYNPVWRKDGDLFVSVYDQDGICLTHGDDLYLIWKNIKSAGSFGSESILPQMLSAQNKGKKISYIWDNTFRSAYVRVVNKEGVRYIVEVGFYPKDNRYITKETVHSVKNYLNEYNKNITFSLVNDPQGPFAKNDITTMVLDLSGRCLANNQNSGLINQNILDLKDSEGVPIIREFLKIAKEKGTGWFTYTWLNAPTEAYIEKVLDPKSSHKEESERYLVIVSNYYPNQGIEVVRDFVTRAASYLKSNGPDIAFKAFTDKVGDFVKGGLAMFAFDLKGNCMANWDDPSLVGQNLIHRTDQQGKYIVKEMIKMAKRRGFGILSYYMKNSTTLAYIQLVNTPNDRFILGCEFYPKTKEEYTRTLVEKASNFLVENEMTKAFKEFSTRTSEFHKGDAHIFVYSPNGRRLVNGPIKDGIWRNFSKTTDQQGVPIIDQIISTALNGGGWVTYKVRNGTRKVFAKAVIKQDKAGNPQTFILGSGYFI